MVLLDRIELSQLYVIIQQFQGHKQSALQHSVPLLCTALNLEAIRLRHL